MTYDVFGGTLNLAQSINPLECLRLRNVMGLYCVELDAEHY